MRLLCCSLRTFCAIAVIALVCLTPRPSSADVPCSIFWDSTPRFQEGTPQDIVWYDFKVKCTSSWTIQYALYTNTGSNLAIAGTSGSQYLPASTWIFFHTQGPVSTSGDWRYDTTYNFEVCLKPYPDEDCTGLRELVIPPGGSSGGDVYDLSVYDHDFVEPLTVGVEASGYIELRNDGHDALDVISVDLNFSGVSVTEGDDVDGTDFTISGGSIHEVGDPFRFTPLSSGTLWLDVRVRLDGGSYEEIDTISLTVEDVSDPCAGITCPNICAAGNVRRTGGSCSGGTCNYSSSYDCDNSDLGPYVEYYCDGANRRAKDRYDDYSCSGGSCIHSDRFENDRLVQICTSGCTETSSTTAVCNACVPNWGCTAWSACNGPDNQTRTCTDANGCGTTSGKPSESQVCPCELDSVTWSDTQVNEGTTVSFSVTHLGQCNGECGTYTIVERDIWPNPDDNFVPNEPFCFGSANVTISWVTEHDPEEFGDSEYDVVVDLGSDSVETASELGVAEVNLCEGVSCPDDCAGDTRLYGGVPTVMGDSCECGYEFENCNSLEPPTTYVEYCSADDTEVRAYDLFHNLTCTGSGSCTGAWEHINDRPVTQCTFGCSLTSLVTAACDPSPCQGVTCQDDCSGDTRLRNGIPTVVGDACECRYTNYNCNVLNTTGPVIEYCSATSDIHSHRQYVDHTCTGSGVCSATTPTWISDTLVAPCAYGCTETSSTTAACDACATSWQCTAWSACNGPDNQTRTCTDANGCGTTSGKPSESQLCPCELDSVIWSDANVNAGTEVEFTVEAIGSCSSSNCFDYEILDYDPIFPDVRVVDPTIACLTTSETKTISWTTMNTWPQIFADEFYVRVTMGGDVISSDYLIVDPTNPCADHPCPDDCTGDVRLHSGTPVRGEFGCECEYAEEDCNTLNSTGSTERYCSLDNNVRSHRQHVDYTCVGSGVCTEAGTSWINDIPVESCDYVFEPRSSFLEPVSSA
ncbi:MAG: hypothetical protein ABIG71_04815 [Candidatus Uhrbacteria bacterium]